MGSRLTRFNFTPGENEQIETVIKVPEEHRSVIHGIVKDHNNKIAKDAVVKLFEVIDPDNKCSMKPITHTFTDECGQFLFGPLEPCKHYAIKVWINNIKIRELIIHPDDCREPPGGKCRSPHKKDRCDRDHYRDHGDKECDDRDACNNYEDDDIVNYLNDED